MVWGYTTAYKEWMDMLSREWMSQWYSRSWCFVLFFLGKVGTSQIPQGYFGSVTN